MLRQLGLHSDAFTYASYGLYVIKKNVPVDQRKPVTEFALEYLKRQPSIFAAFSKIEILSARISPVTPPDELTLIECCAQSIDAERSPDILIAFKPYATLGHIDPSNEYIAWAHGSPWNYDRRVLILAGRSRFDLLRSRLQHSLR